MTQPHPGPTTPSDALAELRAGNDRFVAGTPLHPNQDAERRAALAESQAPFAVILGCSDSRLAAEIIFDRGLGDLFVVRTAGHTLGAEVIGSVEYAVAVLHAPLVVVLGHDRCGAVQSAQTALTTGRSPAGHLGAVVEQILPSVRRAGARADLDDIVDLHIRRTVDNLVDRSDALADAVTAGRCAVVGMSYRLSVGQAGLLTTGTLPDVQLSTPSPAHHPVP